MQVKERLRIVNGLMKSKGLPQSGKGGLCKFSWLDNISASPTVAVKPGKDYFSTVKGHER